MHAQEIIITPELAAEWMKFNVGNRNLPKGNAKYYSELIRRGEFLTTHQALAFTGSPSSPGRLLDGQTRLTAVMDTGIPIKQWVFWGAPEITFKAIDGGKPRSFVDHNPEFTKRTISVVNVFWTLCHSGFPIKITKTDADKIWGVFGHHYETLLEKCAVNEKSLSNSTVKAAFCWCMHQNPDSAQDIADAYRNLVLKRIENLPVSANRLFVKLIGVMGGGWENTRLQFYYTHKAITPSNWSLQKIYGPDEEYYKALAINLKSAAGL